MWVLYNNNPYELETDDCVIRAISSVNGNKWQTVYLALAIAGCKQGRMPDNNSIWGWYLRSLGWTRRAIPDTCPDCYILADFASDHPVGRFIACGQSHVVAVIDGDWYDTSDTGSMPVLYFWEIRKDALQ